MPKLLVLPLVIGAIVLGFGQLFISLFSVMGSPFSDVHPDRTRVLPLLVIHPLACGAMLVSLGLLLATWLKKFGRAVGLAVGIYLFLVLVWPIAQMVLGNSWGDEELAMLSPDILRRFSPKSWRVVIIMDVTLTRLRLPVGSRLSFSSSSPSSSTLSPGSSSTARWGGFRGLGRWR